MDWLIEEEKLDASQRRIFNLAININAVVRGVAGSGKTNLALWRAKYIQTRQGKQNFTVLIYTKALRKFIELGLLKNELDLDRVIHYDRWVEDGSPTVEHIIVDESQDFSETDVKKMISKASKTIILFGDNAQQVYGDTKMKIDAIQKLTNFNIYDLEFNYRLPISVARFAQCLNIENDIIGNCKSTVVSKPRVIEFNSWQAELDFIISEIKTRNLRGSGLQSTAILLPFNTRQSVGKAPEQYSVQNVSDYFKEKEFEHEAKIDDEVSLDFRSDFPKIMTYHSAKGLQFDTVFIPHCGENWYKYKAPMYVALTRTSRQLIVTWSAIYNKHFLRYNKLSTYIQAIPTELYDTK